MLEFVNAEMVSKIVKGRWHITNDKTPLSWNVYGISNSNGNLLYVLVSCLYIYLESVDDLVARGRQQPIEDLIDLNNKNNEIKNTKNTQSQKQDLTRFGQRAYVLGAIKGEIFN